MTHDSLLTLSHTPWWTKLALLATGSLKRLVSGGRGFHSIDEQRDFNARLAGQKARARLGLPL